MMTFATIVGFVCMLGIAVAVIGAVLYEITSRVILIRTLKVNIAIREYSERVGSRLRGDAHWFSEDEATWKLVDEIGEGLQRGVALSTDEARERWRKRRREIICPR